MNSILLGLFFLLIILLLTTRSADPTVVYVVERRAPNSCGMIVTGLIIGLILFGLLAEVIGGGR